MGFTTVFEFTIFKFYISQKCFISINKIKILFTLEFEIVSGKTIKK